MDRKAELRKRMAEVRDALSSEETAGRSVRIRKRVLETPEVNAARSIFTYVSTGAEVDTLELIRVLLAEGKTVSVPRIEGEGILEAHRIGGLEDLAPGKYGIPAPKVSSPLESPPEVCLCPGLAFTAMGDRLGRGKAYYDRFLSKNPHVFAIGLCYDFQLVDEIPVDPTDRRVRLVVTDRRTIRAP